MITMVSSFGFKFGDPSKIADPLRGQPKTAPWTNVVDVRSIITRNPHRLVKLRGRTGKDPAVAADIEKQPGLGEFIDAIRDKAKDLDGTLWIGCFGGKHRSVYVAERIGRELGIPVTHRDMYRS